MDVIINIIIVMVVISSLLKKFQEVSNKGKEITLPDPKRDLAPEMSADSYDEDTVMPVEPSPPTSTQKAPVHRRTLEDLVDQLERGYRDALKPEQSPEPEMIPDVSAKDIFETGQITDSEPIPEKKQTLKAKQQMTHSMPTHQSTLAFSDSALVNGIIMGEILGPPVALRSGVDPHRLV